MHYPDLLSGVCFVCQVYLSLVIVYCWLSSVGCRILAIYIRMSLSAGVVGFWLSGVGCRVSDVGRWMLIVTIFFSCQCPALCITVSFHFRTCSPWTAFIVFADFLVFLNGTVLIILGYGFTRLKDP
jgi:hypothetical protein